MMLTLGNSGETEDLSVQASDISLNLKLPVRPYLRHSS